MLNKSILTNNDIREILEMHYEIKNISKIEINTNGSACIYGITTDSHKFIVKEYQSNYSINSIINEYKICNFLNANGINTSEILKNNDGMTYFRYKGRFLTVQKYIEGYVPKQNEAPQWLVAESGKLLGKINKTLKNYETERYEFKKEWFESVNISKKIMNCEGYIISAKEKKNEYTDKIIQDMEYKIEKIKLLDEIKINSK